jgi:hypothetical protein
MRKLESAECAAAASTDVDESASLLEDLIVGPPAMTTTPPPQAPIVGDVTGAAHPTLRGRVRVSYSDATGARHERWLPKMASLTARVGDRVLLQQPMHWTEPLVTGVVDGLSTRPQPVRAAAGSIILEPDELVRVAAADGTPLIEVFQGEAGAVVRLCQPDVQLELPGRLRVDADSIEFAARRGSVALKATDEVVVEGEAIRLN